MNKLIDSVKRGQRDLRAHKFGLSIFFFSFFSVSFFTLDFAFTISCFVAFRFFGPFFICPLASHFMLSTLEIFLLANTTHCFFFWLNTIYVSKADLCRWPSLPLEDNCDHQVYVA